MENNRREQAPKGNRKRKKKGNPLCGRDLIHLQHVTNGFAETPHGGDKRSQNRKARREERQNSTRGCYE